jgi:signal transduction histidine kinase
MREPTTMGGPAGSVAGDDRARLIAIGELTAGVAHQINNPLFAILGLTELLLLDAAPGTRTQQRLELVHSSGTEIKDSIRSLVEFARDRADERVSVPLAEVVRHTVELFRRISAARQVEIVERYTCESTFVEASRSRLEQLFVSVLSNVCDARSDAAEVCVSVQRDGRHVVARVDAQDDGACLVLRLPASE